MAISKILKTFNAKRDNGSYVFASNSSGSIRADLSAEADTGAQADAAIAQQITDRRDAAQGNVDELNAVLTIVG